MEISALLLKYEIDQLNVTHPSILEQAYDLAHKICERGRPVILEFSIRDNLDTYNYYSRKLLLDKPWLQYEDIHLLYNISAMLLTGGAMVANEENEDGSINVYGATVDKDYSWIPLNKTQLKFLTLVDYNEGKFLLKKNDYIIHYIEIKK